jgi:putative Mg2+ transporter-C (MgtC) family protein
MGELSQWELLGRFALAAALGAIVGVERESRNHAAGIRTCALAALGACVFTAIGAYSFNTTDAVVDPTRVAAQVVAGIGFIGAGAILRHGASIRGLTTAAALWITAALGVAVGAGAYMAAVSATVVGCAVLVSARLVKPVFARGSARVLEIEYERGHGTLGPLMRDLESSLNGRLNNIRIDDDDSSQGLRRVAIDITTRDDPILDDIARRLRSRAEIHSVRWFTPH